MGYIIVWRNTLQDPFLHISDTYHKEEAEAAKDNELFCDYAIFEEVKS